MSGFFSQFKNHLDYSRRNLVVYGRPWIENIEPTDYCNLRCPMCVSRDPESGYVRRGNMSVDGLRYIVEQNLDLLEGQIVWLHFNGESFLNSDLIQMIQLLSTFGVRSRLSTNATLLNPEMSGKLFGSGLEEIVFSVDGASKDIYQALRQGGNFEAVMHNIHHFLETKEKYGYDRPITQVQMVVNTLNHEQVADFISYWKQTPVNWINVKKISSRAGKVVDMNLAPQGKTNKQDYPCLWPWRSMIVLANGNVVPCCTDLTGQLVVGNAYEQNLRDIWNGEEMTDLRRRHMKGDVEGLLCESCDDWRGYNDPFPVKLAKEIGSSIGLVKRQSKHNLIRNKR